MKSTNLHSNDARNIQPSCWPDCVEDSFERIVSQIANVSQMPFDVSATLMNAVAESIAHPTNLA